MGNGNKNRLLKSTVGEYFKAWNVYDGSNRLIERYEAPLATGNGDPCLKTTITYVGASRNVQAQKEEEAPWNSSWDI